MEMNLNRVSLHDREIRDKLFELLDRSLNDLPERHRHVVESRFGISTSSPQTLLDLAKHYRISRNRVSNLEKQALQKLHVIIREKHFLDSLE